MKRLGHWGGAGFVIGEIVLVCLLGCGAVCFAQSSSAARVPAPLPGAVIVSSGTAALDLNPRPDSGEVRREIRDPHTGQVWLLSLDPATPGGPGRLVLAAKQSQTESKAGSAGLAEGSVLPIIHAGDRVTLEEETPTVSARLEAIALGPAAAGAPLRVRLRLGGQIVPAIAVTARRVALAQVLSAQGAQP